MQEQVDTLHPVMLALLPKASEDDAVRVTSQEYGRLYPYPYCFHRPGFEGAEEQWHKDDFAMVGALSFMDNVDWERTLPASRMVGLIDNPPECDYGCP